jgi:hypothetical protein
VGDIAFTASEVAVLAAVFGPFLTAIGVLFHALLRSQDSRIKDMGDANVKLQAALETSQATGGKLAQGLLEATAEFREMRQDLVRGRRAGDRA